jgi:hypothetical protein
MARIRKNNEKLMPEILTPDKYYHYKDGKLKVPVEKIPVDMHHVTKLAFQKFVNTHHFFPNKNRLASYIRSLLRGEVRF